jgi:hypothetical protein
MKTRTKWRDKLDNPNLPKLLPVPPRMQGRFGTGTMLIPSARDVQAFIESVPTGTVTTISRIRQCLAEQYLADVTCPLVTGLFLRILAEAAEEDVRDGRTAVTPYWRVVKDDGSMHPRFPGGVEQQARRLHDEGVDIVRSGSGKAPRAVMRSHAVA